MRQSTADNLKRTEREISIIKALYDDSRWFRFPKDLMFILPPRETILFAFLLNQRFLYTRNTKNQKKTGNWFYCAASKIKQEMGIPIRSQTKLFVKLEKSGYITTKKYGNPSRRFILINFEKLDQDIWDKTCPNGDDGMDTE